MRVNLVGFSRSHGISQKTNQPYDIAELFVLNPQTSVSRENFKKECGGFEVSSINCEPSLLARLAGGKFPREVELETDVRMSYAGLRAYVVGVKG